MLEDEIADVNQYFQIKQQDLPIIVAYNPLKVSSRITRSLFALLLTHFLHQDRQYKSPMLDIQANNIKEILSNFIVSVIEGSAKHTIKSEPIPVKSVSDYVVKAVGSTLSSIISDEEKDVLLIINSPKCSSCSKYRPTFEVLAKAFQGEDRIVIAKIDGVLNDLPATWKISDYPTLLWFPAKDKPYKSNIDSVVPHPYWDAGHSLNELFFFVVRHSSFDSQSLKIASMEQLITLTSDIEVLAAKYQEEERWLSRNEGRPYYENELIDYFIGEIVYDGKRWHLALVSAVILVLLTVIIVLLLKLFYANKSNKVKTA